MMTMLRFDGALVVWDTYANVCSPRVFEHDYASMILTSALSGSSFVGNTLSRSGSFLIGQG